MPKVPLKGKDMKDELINKWKFNLGIDQEITTVSIDDAQVVYPDDLEDKCFVGVCFKDGTIYHSRDLTEEDIVHELLHVSNRDMSDEWVEMMTEKLMEGEYGR